MTNTNKNRPTHTIYKVTGDGQDAKWIKVGVGFKHHDGRGLALMFDAIPVEGRITVRQNKPRTSASRTSNPSAQMQ